MEDPDRPAATLEALRRENERLRASLRQSTVQLAESSSQVTRLRTSLQQSSQEAELLRAERVELLSELKQREHKIDSLQHQLQALLRRYLGRSSERLDPNQKLLFEDVLDRCIPETPDEEASDSKSSQSPRQAKGHGRPRLPTNLPREKVVHDLPEDEKPCPCCGKMRHIIGKQTHEQLEYIPAKLKVIEHVRLKYGCRHCEDNASPDGPQIVLADKPMQPIEKGLAAPGLLSYVIVSKYGDHLPMHRLEGILKRYGIEIARSTLCDWAAQCAELLSPLVDLMRQRVLQSKVIHTDDTPVKVQDRSLDRTRTGRFWVYLGDADHPYTVFAYTPNRRRDGPMEFLRDWGQDERVYLQADAFGGYDGIYAGEAGGQVTEVACWAHARRKFYDARHSDAPVSAQALAHIRLLYDVEKQAKKAAETSVSNASERRAKTRTEKPTKLEAAGETAREPSADKTSAQRLHEWLVEHQSLVKYRVRLRTELAVPRLAAFKTWLESQQAERGGPVLPKSPMGQAIQYALNQWDALCVYTGDGRLAIDNNASENALRRVAVGRKNSYDLCQVARIASVILHGIPSSCRRPVFVGIFSLLGETESGSAGTQPDKG